MANKFLLEDLYPTHYMPNVGRQVMQQGGEPITGEVSYLEDERTPLPTFAQPQAQQVTQALDVARELPKKEYEPFGVLPFKETEEGVSFDPYAGLLGTITRPAKYFYETMTGQKEMDPTGEEAIRAATDIAGNITMGAGAFERPAGALAAGASRYYHGTPAKFETFELAKSPSGFHLTESPEVAREYAGKTSPNVYTVESTHSPERMIRADELIENQPVFGQLSDSPVDMTQPMTGERYYQALTQMLGGPLAATEYLKRVGVHGMQYPGSGKGRGHVSIFDPSLIRKVPERITNPIGMHSEAAEAVRNLPQQKGTIEQMLAMIRQKVNPEEIYWSGVQQAFQPGQKVTAEELASHFESKLPQVQEKIYAHPKDVPPPRYNAEEEWENAINAAEDAGDEALAEQLGEEFDRWMYPPLEGRSGYVENSPRYSGYVTPGGTNYREIVLHHPGKEGAPAYIESHYDEPNIVGHLRMSDMVGPSGEKILNVHEFQSDWGQAARKKGVASGKEAEEREALVAKQQEMQQRITDEVRRIKQAAGERYRNANFSEPEIERLLDRMSPADLARVAGGDELQNDYMRLIEENARLYGDIKATESRTPAAPYVTSRESQHHTPGWTDLLIKRVMQEAERGGYDKVVWDTPAEQARRYMNLPKIVKGMEGYYGDVLPRRFKKVVPEAKLGEHQVGQVRNAYDKDSVAEFVTGAATTEEHKKFTDLIKEGMNREQALRAIGMHDEYLLNEADKHGLGDFLEGLNVSKLGDKHYVLYDGDTTKGMFDSEREAQSALHMLGAEKAKEALESSGTMRPGFEMTPELVERVRKGFSAYRYGGEVEDALNVARSL
jgi:hypothetical protein